MVLEQLETKRLILRHVTMKDANAFYELLRDEEVNRFLPMFPFKDLQEAKAYIQTHYLDAYEKNDGYHYAICLKEENEVIGYLHVSGEESHDFGYGLEKAYWHQGIVSEAGAAFLEMLKTTDIPFITATHDIHNPHSGAVMKKLGMRYQYTYEEQWMPKDQLVHFRMYQMNFSCDSDFVYRGYWNRYPHVIETLSNEEKKD